MIHRSRLFRVLRLFTSHIWKYTENTFWTKITEIIHQWQIGNANKVRQIIFFWRFIFGFAPYDKYWSGFRRHTLTDNWRNPFVISLGGTCQYGGCRPFRLSRTGVCLSRIRCTFSHTLLRLIKHTVNFVLNNWFSIWHEFNEPWLNG